MAAGDLARDENGLLPTPGPSPSSLSVPIRSPPAPESRESTEPAAPGPLRAPVRARRGAGSPTIVVTCGRVGEQLVGALLDHPEYGLAPLGYVDDSPSLPASGLRVPVLGGIESLAGLVVEHRATTVVVACSSSQESVIVDVLRTCDRLSCDIFLVPRLYELFGARRDNELLQGLPLARLRRGPYRTLAWRGKRALDVSLAMVGLVLLAPVIAACGLGVRLEGGPGILVRRERVGPDGRAFAMLAFRAMPRPGEPADPAIGAVGRMLRHTSLDELPRLWNVVRGEMSLVGPRPERPFYLPSLDRRSQTTARHRVPAGITGSAQVTGARQATDLAERVRFADYYVESWSLWEDVKILLRTAGQVAREGGTGTLRTSSSRVSSVTPTGAPGE